MNSLKMYGIDQIFKDDPDVVCLQELPIKLFDQIKEKYDVDGVYIKDFAPNNPKLRSLKGSIATFTKHKIIKNTEFAHFNEDKHSRLSNFMYKLVNNSIELHNSMVTQIEYKGKRVDVLNARLSCALGINDHLEMLRNCLNSIDGDVMLVCGDLNTPEPEMVNKMLSWIRNFEEGESDINARELSEKIFEEFGFKNIFSKVNTSIMPFAQFDHILIPNDIEILNKNRGPFYLSDHNVLTAELSL